MRSETGARPACRTSHPLQPRKSRQLKHAGSGCDAGHNALVPAMQCAALQERQVLAESRTLNQRKSRLTPNCRRLKFGSVVTVLPLPWVTSPPAEPTKEKNGEMKT